MSQALPPGTCCPAEVDSGTAGFSRGQRLGQWGAGTLGTRLGSGWRRRSQQVGTGSRWPACPPRAPTLPGRRVSQLGAVARALPHLLKGCPRAEPLSWGSQGLPWGSRGDQGWPRWHCPGPQGQRGAWSQWARRQQPANSRSAVRARSPQSRHGVWRGPGLAPGLFWTSRLSLYCAVPGVSLVF